jgi:hypothetical protein
MNAASRTLDPLNAAVHSVSRIPMKMHKKKMKNDKNHEKFMNAERRSDAPWSCCRA